MDYHEYLQSEGWKDKRHKRILFDQKCAICGSTEALQVHHIRYDNVPYEHMGDLLTVCRICHVKIEIQKPKPWYDSANAVNNVLSWKFCQDYANDDLSGHGKLDFCQNETIKKYWYPYIKEHIGTTNATNGVANIQQHFRNKRYEIILKFIDGGFPQYLCYNRTLFSHGMISKVYKDPEMAKRLIEDEVRNTQIIKQKINNFILRGGH